jgi:hypothetical protein
MLTRLDLIKRAQMRIGDEPLTSETAPGADTYISIFDSVRDNLLSLYPWTWSTVTRRLTRLAAKPAQHWQHYFQLPSDMIGAPRAVFASDEQRTPFTVYELTENRLAADVETIWMRYTKRADIGLWPGYFVELNDTVLRSEFSLSIAEDRGKYQALREIAFGSESMVGQGGLFHLATSLDAQSKPSPIIAEGSNPLIAARY